MQGKGRGERDGSPVPRPALERPGALILALRFRGVFAHRLPTQLDAVGAMYDPVENPLGHRGVAYLLMPLGHR